MSDYILIVNSLTWAEIELIRSDKFRMFVEKQSNWKPHEQDYRIFYEKMKAKDLQDLGNKFRLVDFLNKVRRMARG